MTTELNKKLAEWRWPLPEFRVTVNPRFIAIDRQFTKEEEDHVLSIDPTLRGAMKVGQWYRHENIKILTESVDACIEHLGPKLYEQGYYYHLLQWNDGQHKAIINKKTVEWAETASEAVAETPALAFGLAVEKLIDERVI